MKVVALGQCSLDYLASVDAFPREDTKKEVLDLAVEGGGPAATALVALSRLKVSTSFIGVVGDDEAGRAIARGLKAEGVGLEGLKVVKGAPSQAALIIVNRKGGSRTILYRRPPLNALGPKDIRPSLIKGSSFLLLDGLLAEPSLRAAEVARGLGIPVMLDAGTLREGTLGLASLCDYVVASEAFSRALSKTPLETLKRLSSIGLKAATVTLGKKGSVTIKEGVVFRTPAFAVKAVDTTGAGDVFHGGYIYGLLKGWDIRKTVEFASAFAALKCLSPGGRPGIPTLSKTLRFMKAGKAKA